MADAIAPHTHCAMDDALRLAAMSLLCQAEGDFEAHAEFVRQQIERAKQNGRRIIKDYWRED